MKIKLTPDEEIRVKKIRVGNVPTLVLQPKAIEPRNTGILWIHGGGYILGLKEMVYMSRAVDLVKDFGVTVFSPGYRMALLHPYPAAFEDCFQVLEYMTGLGFDAIIIGGESAGGGLCAALCMKARDRGIPIAFQMPLYPMLDDSDTESSRDNHGKIWNTRRNHFGWRMYLRGLKRKAVPPYAAPARQTDYHNLPPCYTFVGDGEPFYAETLAYVAQLQAAGVEASVDVYHSDTHAFDMLYPEREESKEAIRKFQDHFAHALEAADLRTAGDDE